jgi:hypothetical protein
VSPERLVSDIRTECEATTQDKIWRGHARDAHVILYIFVFIVSMVNRHEREELVQGNICHLRSRHRRDGDGAATARSVQRTESTGLAT